MKICMCVDVMGCGDKTQEDEYDELEKEFNKMLKSKKLNFERDVFPYNLQNKKTDIYIFDFGGFLPGCQDMINSHYRGLIEAIEDHPSTLFIIYSSFTGEQFKAYLEQECKDIKSHHNVIINNGENLLDKVSSWIN